MKSTVRPAQRAAPRILGAVALTVLGACGVLVLTTAPRSNSLVGRSNWQLAATLPVQADFPAEWNYAIRGSVGWATPPDSTTAEPDGPLIPTAAYTPADCGSLPAALAVAADSPANVHVDTTPVGIASAKLYWRDSVAAGEPDTDEPDTDFVITAPGEPSSIGEYRDWLRRCDAYRVTVFDPQTRTRVERFATTTVEAPDPGAALTVTRTFVDVNGGAEPVSHRVSYYPVRGLLLTCSTSMRGADADLVRELGARTARKLAAL
ncbi:hypothetical protein KIH27_02775 [Mycobacterium sp. M1]|uniref:PknH-like extracellular domain-containing protein n=1 Tax=Mycolicibacter acidiphilus TaxID=2835306 RepID=A0ABS5RFZ0_9MYCO|nr:hypothetical protein [Mycolicibacter acidiphilus]MBS9532508.1 hypothetical protein [Mycolicibacter acidiphilus]